MALLRWFRALVAGLLFVPGIAAAQAPAAISADTLPLAVGDVVRIEIWLEREISGDFVVDPFGTVTLPLLGDQKVAGTPRQVVRDSLMQGYRVQLRNPAIRITFLRQVNILGQVSRPGTYLVEPNFSIAGAVAQAGGPNPLGDLNRTQVFRRNELLLDDVQVGATLNELGIVSGDQIVIGERNWFARNSTFVVSTVISVASIVIALLR
jgi:protein involved in polysaccharide export with SLBB domain